MRESLYSHLAFENFFTCKKFSSFPKCAETIRFRPLRRAPKALPSGHHHLLKKVDENFDLIRRASVVTKALPCVKTAVLYKTKARNSVQLQAGGRKFYFSQSTRLCTVGEQSPASSRCFAAGALPCGSIKTTASP